MGRHSPSRRRLWRNPHCDLLSGSHYNAAAKLPCQCTLAIPGNCLLTETTPCALINGPSYRAAPCRRNWESDLTTRENRPRVQSPAGLSPVVGFVEDGRGWCCAPRVVWAKLMIYGSLNLEVGGCGGGNERRAGMGRGGAAAGAPIERPHARRAAALA